ncbi:MAG: hypothetical protein P8Y71_28515 [Pseudolabrys sp.]|jgi:hypothetical protein
MLKMVIGAAALAFVTLPAMAIAQNNMSGPNYGQVTLPPHNSGAGVNGMQGNKSGSPPAKPSTTGQGMSNQNTQRTGKADAAKVNGMPGGKAGPAVMPPSNSKSDSGSK